MVGMLSNFSLALASSFEVVEGNLVMGGVVGFDFFALLSPSDDDIASIPANVDDCLKIASGRIMEVTASLMVHLRCATPTLGMLCIVDLALLLLGAI